MSDGAITTLLILALFALLGSGFLFLLALLKFKLLASHVFRHCALCPTTRVILEHGLPTLLTLEHRLGTGGV